MYQPPQYPKRYQVDLILSTERANLFRFTHQPLKAFWCPKSISQFTEDPEAPTVDEGEPVPGQVVIEGWFVPKQANP